MENYEFTNETDYLQSYLMARIKFKKIFANLNESEFRSNFDELFYSEQNYKLFLKEGETLICGGMGFVYGDKIFIDIFFWNYHSIKKHSLGCYIRNPIARHYFDHFFRETSKIGVSEAILPLGPNRKNFKSFKKHNEIFFRSSEKFVTDDPHINKLYSNHYLLRINYENYFKEK